MSAILTKKRKFDEGKAFQEIKLNMDATTKKTRSMIKSQKKATDETHDLAHYIESQKTITLVTACDIT